MSHAAGIPSTVRRVFTESFTARDIAEPLASFDADAPAADVRAFMGEKDFDVLGVRRRGMVEGYVEQGQLTDGPCGSFQHSLEEATLLDDSAPLLSVLMKLNEVSFAFVRVFGEVGGIITRADLQKPPVRMWLFGIVTLIEMRFSDLIERHFPADAWKKFISEARLQKAQELLEERKRRNQGLRLFDCLQFSDKGQVIARNEDLRGFTIFPSRRQAEEAVKKLEQLRNNLAHSQDILATDWETIIQLCEFINRQ